MVKGSPYTVPVHPIVRNFLASYEGGNDSHFTPPYVRRRQKEDGYAQKMLNSNFAHWREIYSLDKGPGFLKDITFHCLRHTFVFGIAMADGTKRETQLLAGHASAAITEVYTHADAQKLAPVVERLDYTR